MNATDQKTCQLAIASFRKGDMTETAVLKILLNLGVDPDDARETLHLPDDCLEIENPTEGNPL